MMALYKFLGPRPDYGTNLQVPKISDEIMQC